MKHPPRTRTIAVAALGLLAAAPLALDHADAQTVRRPRTPTTRTAPTLRDAGSTADASLSVANVVNRNDRITGLARGGGLCVAQRGCAAPQAVSSVVPSGVHGEALDGVWNRRFELSGQRVSVLGTLSADGACTEMACGDTHGCCNHCRGNITLRAGRRSLALGLADDARFTCRGDDSGLCCGTEVPTGLVIVVGTLAPIPSSGGDYRIENPTLYRSR